MEKKTKKLNHKLRRKTEIEEKIISKERTPSKSLVPQAQSTPVESARVTNVASESEYDDDDESDICFTQDALTVQWDYSNTPRGKDKKKQSKTKKKSKGGKLSKNKRRPEFSPIEAVALRKRVFKEEPKPDLTNLIAGLKALAEKVDNQGINESVVQRQVPNETSYTNSVAERTNHDNQKPNYSRTVRKKLLASDSPNSRTRKQNVPRVLNENYTSLFDDEDDDCILRCSQEVEQKLCEPDPVNCVRRDRLSSAISSENSHLDENKIKNCKHKSVTQKEVPAGSCYTNSFTEHLNDDIQKPKCSKTARKKLLAPNSVSSGTRKENVPKTVKENYTLLLDDEEDDCILRCSQEMEQKLCEPGPVNCVRKDHLSSGSKNCRLDQNKVKNHRNEAAICEDSEANEDGLSVDVEIEEEDCYVTDTQKLKESCIMPSLSHSDLVKNAQRGINDSYTALFEDDADDCMVLCSQEVEDKLSDKHVIINNNDGERLSNKDNQTNTAVRCYNKEKLDSSANGGFDDTLDMLLENFTEEDINKMSQGVTVNKNLNSLQKNSRNVKQRRSIKSKIPVTNKNVQVFNNYKQTKPFSTASVANKFGASTSNRTQCEVPTVACANLDGAKLNCDKPVTVCGNAEKKSYTNLMVNLMTLHPHIDGKISNSSSKSSPQKCSPEEIERKRLEARKKLEMKKCSMRQTNFSHFCTSKKP